MKILANDGISEAGISKLTQAGFEVITEKVSQENLAQHIKKNEITALLVRSATQVPKELIDACPNLKLIGRGGVGMDNIDIAHAEEKGIKVINTPAASSNSVAELVMAHLTGLCRFLHQSNRKMPLEGDSKFSELKKAYGKGRELRGSTMGIIGMGRIGKNVASLAIGMGMTVVMHDPFIDEANIELEFFDGQKNTFKVKSTDKETLLKQADFVSVHVPAQKDYIIGKEELQMMPKGSGIFNTARGGIVDEAALLESIENNHTAFAALDVFETEPKPTLKLLMNSNISLSPHIGGATKEAQDRIGEELADQIIAYLTK